MASVQGEVMEDTRETPPKQELTWVVMPDGEERCVTFHAGFHLCNKHDPPRSRGIGSTRIAWTLKYGGGAIEFFVYTGFGMSHEAFMETGDEWCNHGRHVDGYPISPPTAGPVTIHVPDEDGDECPVINTKCRYDFGYSIGDIAFKILRDQGGDALWKWLREFLYSYLLDSQDSSNEVVG